MFNALKYTKDLEAVGVSREQAETHAQMLAQVVENNMVSKKVLKQDLKELEYRLIIKLSSILGVMLSIGFAVLAALSKKS